MSTFSAANTNLVPPQQWRNCFPQRHRGTHARPSVVEIPRHTGPLDLLRDRRSVLVVDCENLTISGRNLGYELDYGKLAGLLKRATRSISLHAVLSVQEGDHRDRAYMEEAGFQVHTRLIRYLPNGRKAANADNLFAFTAGNVISRSTANVVLLGSGDGQLCDDVVQCVKALPGKREILTLSVAGSTSGLLDARTHSSITANVEVGCDLLAPAWAQAIS